MFHSLTNKILHIMIHTCTGTFNMIPQLVAYSPYYESKSNINYFFLIITQMIHYSIQQD